ncbi:MAG: sugar phosphate isomerase/epimerase family protein [Verrucomicrobiota bacterium]
MKPFSLILLSLALASPSLADQPKIAVMETALGLAADVDSFAAAKEAGYNAIQMHSGKPEGMKRGAVNPAASLAIGDEPAVLESWKKASQEHGVEIVSLCAGSLNACEIWDTDREAAMRIAKQTIDGCHALGINVMLFPFFGPSNFQESDEALEGVADFMKELLPYAEEKEVVIGIEAPVTTVRVMELIEKLGYPDHLKVYYDTGNLFEKEDIYETIAKYGKDHFCEVHIKAANSGVAGEGDIDLQKLADALDAAEYDEWLVYEANRHGKDPVANLKSIQTLTSLREKN